MYQRHYLRITAFVLLLSSVLSTEAVEAWRRDLAILPPVSQAQRVLIAHSAAIACPTRRKKADRDVMREGRPKPTAVTVADDGFVDIPAYSAPALKRPNLAPDVATLPAYPACRSALAQAEAVSFLPDSRGSPIAPSPAPTPPRAPPAS